VFYLDVSKVDLDVTYTCMLQAYVLSVSRRFVRMFASASSGCCIANVSDVCFKCFICLFYILQLLHLDVLKVDWVLHMGCVWEAAGGADEV